MELDFYNWFQVSIIAPIFLLTQIEFFKYK